MCPRGERRSAAAPEPGDTVGTSVWGPKAPCCGAARTPCPCASSGGRTESGGVRVPATDCESARPAGEVCGEKERRKVSTEQQVRLLRGRKVIVVEVVGDCQVRQDQVRQVLLV